MSCDRLIRIMGSDLSEQMLLTHWGRVTHMRQWTYHHWFKWWLVPERHQAIIWTNAGILLIRPLGTNFSEISIKIHIFSFKEMHLKMSSAKVWPYCLGLNVLIFKCAPYLVSPLVLLGSDRQYFKINVNSRHIWCDGFMISNMISSACN